MNLSISSCPSQAATSMHAKRQLRAFFFVSPCSVGAPLDRGSSRVLQGSVLWYLGLGSFSTKMSEPFGQKRAARPVDAMQLPLLQSHQHLDHSRAVFQRS